ncbi:MAG: hypothetical protein M3R04_01285 [bacterium]|nr:hypothetical protein [bacterium]
MRFLISLVASIMTTTAFAAETPAPLETTPALPAQLVSLKLSLVEMRPGGAIAGGFLDAHAIEAGREGGIRISLVNAESKPTAVPLDKLIADGDARVLAAQDFAVPSGSSIVLAQMATAPFDLLEEAEISPDDLASQYPGQLGLAVRIEPSFDASEFVTLKITSVARVAESWVSTGSVDTSTMRQLNYAQMSTALRVGLGTTISIADILREEDRNDLAELPGMDVVAAQQPFFASPELGSVLYLIITPTLIDAI